MIFATGSFLKWQDATRSELAQFTFRRQRDKILFTVWHNCATLYLYTGGVIYADNFTN